MENSLESLVSKYKDKDYSQDIKLRQGPDYYDCSSLVKNFLIDLYPSCSKTSKLPDNTREYENAYKNKVISLVSKPEDLILGDMLWKPGHVAVYIGNNEVLTARSANKKSTVYSLKDYKSYFGFEKIYRLNT